MFINKCNFECRQAKCRRSKVLVSQTTLMSAGAVAEVYLSVPCGLDTKLLSPFVAPPPRCPTSRSVAPGTDESRRHVGFISERKNGYNLERQLSQTHVHAKSLLWIGNKSVYWIQMNRRLSPSAICVHFPHFVKKTHNKQINS